MWIILIFPSLKEYRKPNTAEWKFSVTAPKAKSCALDLPNLGLQEGLSNIILVGAAIRNYELFISFIKSFSISPGL